MRKEREVINMIAHHCLEMDRAGRVSDPVTIKDLTGVYESAARRECGKGDTVPFLTMGGDQIYYRLHPLHFVMNGGGNAADGSIIDKTVLDREVKKKELARRGI